MGDFVDPDDLDELNAVAIYTYADADDVEIVAPEMLDTDAEHGVNTDEEKVVDGAE